MRQFSHPTFAGLACAARGASRDSIIDIHQHTVYGKPDGAQLVLHQRAMGMESARNPGVKRPFALDWWFEPGGAKSGEPAPEHILQFVIEDLRVCL
jgi:hypothetical protein